MEITYDGIGNLTIRFDDGRELGLDEILNLDKCLTLTRNSREWNRKRVVELEDMLERGVVDVATSTDPGELGRLAGQEDRIIDLEAQVRRLEATLAESRELVQFKEKVADEIDQEAERLRSKVREYDRDRKTERDRADRMTAQANRMETDRAELEAEHRRSLAARDRLLETATRKASAARDFLSTNTVAEARENIVTSRGAVLADAIGMALRVLDQA
ncbi:Pas54 [Actinoplanes phage phiAsp2]|uniref:Pas54 n=1 Tax=Actinoplanes phage phiAsp2 TaxID=279303 RepID=Q6J7X7_9CAUD|nr:Pas54 [Actinoplanes phage phiAsp2]AAT36802.1 Pas54 [Actinoplanes phage phiAsp2]